MAGATELFTRKGFAATTTREIAQVVGLTAGALYTHYESKEALFAATAARYRDNVIFIDNPLEAHLAQTQFPHDLPALAESIRDLIGRHRPYWLLWYVDVLEFDGAHFESALAPSSLLANPTLRRRLDEVKAEGILRIDPDRAFVMVYMHLFNYFLVEKIFRGNDHYGIPEADAIAAINDVFCHGMLAEKKS